jgi:riboflavin synthase
LFSGIIETTSKIVSVEPFPGGWRIEVQRPESFNDISLGDSIAVNGVCLTVEAVTTEKIQFALAPETLKITGWNSSQLLHSEVNLERSMRANDRVHGHFVLGHVDGIAKLIKRIDEGESCIFVIELPLTFRSFVWKKGSLTLNGVSLTLNGVSDKGSLTVEVCLIPETLKRTNLRLLCEQDLITFEVDSMARAFVHLWKTEKNYAQI